MHLFSHYCVIAYLREFELRLPRSEVEEVDQLRVRWQDLLDLAQEVNHTLLKERRSAFEQELDKQVKGFVVEVIQFRNAFDAQGPAVPGNMREREERGGGEGAGEGGEEGAEEGGGEGAGEGGGEGEYWGLL